MLVNYSTDPTVRYLGDGVYATYDRFQIWLSTEDGMHIALEPAVFEALIKYAQDTMNKEN